ncbi:MAG: DNA repair protein RadC [Clostridia bacterium]|nr:DNA repair protein RadC [Clostridia bacterium]
MHEGHRERLRQIYTENGIGGFHDHQVLELLLTYVIPRVDTNPLAHRLLERYGSLRKVFDAPIHDLMEVKGIGQKAAVLLKLVGDTQRRIARYDAQSVRISTPAAAMKLAMTLFDDQRYEAVYLISLNKAHEVVHIDKVSSGTVSQTTVYPRLIAEYVMRHGAQSAILVHNHPSGSIEPSKEDIEVTKDILNALAAIEVKLDDHIIVSSTNAYSCLQKCFLNSFEQEEETLFKEAK